MKRVWTAVLVALVALSASPMQSSATANFRFDRISGDDRYATAAALARSAFPNGVSGAVIATGETFPDALAGSFLAGYVNAPILLVSQNDVPDATSTALAQLGVSTLVLLGGRAAISDSVAAELDQSYEVLRLEGADRFITAANVALAVNPADIGELNGKRTAFITYGYNFADAIAAGPLANAGKFPVLLTPSTGLASPAATALDRTDIAHVVIIGGELAVGDQVRRDIEAMGITTQRIFGADRFATSTALADFAVAELDFSRGHVNLAQGIDPRGPNQGFADALASTPHAGRERSPLLLTDPRNLSDVTRAWIETNAETLSAGHIVGGEGAVAPAVRTAAEFAARNVPGEVVRASVLDDTYAYVPAGSSLASTVTYSREDIFLVDGQRVTIGTFESAMDPGDRVHAVRGERVEHRLTEVAPSSINGRTVGNIDLSANSFAFINDVTGDGIRTGLTYSVETGTFFVDGLERPADVFEGALSEGDVLTIEDGDFGDVLRLTNKAPSGSARAIENSSPENANQISLQVGFFGDVAETSASAKFVAQNPANNDPAVSGVADDVFAGDVTTYDQFRAQLSEGDIVVYERNGGVELFTLRNRPLGTISGEAVSITPDGSGGTVKLRLADGTEQDVAYLGSGEFVVDGISSLESEFEQAFSPGDRVSVRPLDTAASQSQRVTLDNTG